MRRIIKPALSDKVMLSDWIPYGTPVKLKQPRFRLRDCFTFWRLK